MRKLPFLAICLLVLCCTLPDPGCDDGSCNEKCEEVLKRHVKSLVISMYMECPYESACKSRVTFGLVQEYGFPSSTCYKKYEYRLESDSVKENVSMNSSAWLQMDADDHVRFSLFDVDGAEKKYDIDFSEIIHSYSILGDSVEISVPYYAESVSLYKQTYYRSGHNIIELVPDSLKNGKYSFFADSLYLDEISFKYGIMNPTSFGTDSIDVSAYLHYRECERREDEFVCK